jgi:peptide/nickel transport system substrate-binding protein
MKRLLVLMLILVVCTLIVASCANNPTSTTSTQATSSTSVKQTSTTATPKTGGVLRISESVPTDTPFGDPLNIAGPATMRASIVLQRLILPETPSTYQYVLATGIKLASDNSYYDVSLRQGVKFHDGVDFNAQAVKWNLDRVITAKRGLTKVKSIEVVDDYTVRLNLSSWDNRILNDLTTDACYMISPAAFQSHDAKWANLNPIGTGPFIFKEIKNAQIVVFEKNTNYWKKGFPYLNGVECHYIPDTTIFEAALKAGEVDCQWEGDEKFLASLEADPNSKFSKIQGTNYLAGLVFYMNTVDSTSAWYDSRMRQAFEYAIDKETVMKSVGSPYRQAAYNIIRGLEDATKINIEPRKYNPNKAKELMTAAGYPNGLKFDVYVIPVFWNDTYVRSVLLAFQEQLKTVGFNAQIANIELATQREYGKNPLPSNSVMLDSIRGNSILPAEVVVQNLSDTSIFFKGVKRPAEWPGLLEKVLQSKDVTEQLSILANMENLAYDQAMFVSIMKGIQQGIGSKRVHDMVFGRVGFQLESTWLSD